MNEKEEEESDQPSTADQSTTVVDDDDPKNIKSNATQKDDDETTTKRKIDQMDKDQSSLEKKSLDEGKEKDETLEPLNKKQKLQEDETTGGDTINSNEDEEKKQNGEGDSTEKHKSTTELKETDSDAKASKNPEEKSGEDKQQNSNSNEEDGVKDMEIDESAAAGKDENGETANNQKNIESPTTRNKGKLESFARAKQEESTSKAEKEKGNPYESLKYTMITNDGKPESLIKLVALKSLFAKQLPKMPRSYIARLVFDRRHTSLAILNDDPATKDTDEEVIGAICYRPFYDMRFAEIAFCAVNASHQVKGYGTKLMNLVKQQGACTGIEYFITYADNYAIGYFKKQGFTKSIAMPKGRYQGLIKDYDGGTMMECYVHPSIDFTRIPEMLSAQREFILSRIRLKAQSTKVYDPLPQNWSPNLEGVSRANESAARALAIPGMVEAGWTMSDLLSATGQGKDLDRAKNALKSELLGIVRKVEEQQFSWPFREPVDTNEVKDYLEVIKEAIDLSTIDKRIRKGDHYKSKKMLYADLMLMVNNCKLYNDEASTYVQCAINLEAYLKKMFAYL